MPEKPTELGYVSNKMYEVAVRIKDLDYTNDLIEIVLSSSLSTAYQVIDVTLMLDPNDVIRRFLAINFGQQQYFSAKA